MTAPSQDFVARSLELAREMLRDARDLSGSGSLRSAADRAYYAMFHGARAILRKEGVDIPRSHGGLQRLFAVAGWRTCDLISHTSMTMKTISISELKATLSEQLRAVKAGDRIVVTDRGRPVAMLAPLGDAASDAELEDLVEAGLVSPGSGPVDPDFWERDRPSDPTGSVREALLEERESGW